MGVIYKHLIYGSYWRISDSGAYCHYPLYQTLENNPLKFLDSKPLPKSNDSSYENQCTEHVPFVFIIDDVFPLRIHCMKPYSQKEWTNLKRFYNYCATRKRRVTKNAFEIWFNHFRVFTTTMDPHPDTTSIVALASVVLHNMLRDMLMDFQKMVITILEQHFQRSSPKKLFYRDYKNLDRLTFIQKRKNWINRQMNISISSKYF